MYLCQVMSQLCHYLFRKDTLSIGVIMLVVRDIHNDLISMYLLFKAPWACLRRGCISKSVIESVALLHVSGDHEGRSFTPDSDEGSCDWVFFSSCRPAPHTPVRRRCLDICMIGQQESPDISVCSRRCWSSSSFDLMGNIDHLMSAALKEFTLFIN